MGDVLLVFKQESIVASTAGINIYAYTGFLHIHRYNHPEYQPLSLGHAENNLKILAILLTALREETIRCVLRF